MSIISENPFFIKVLEFGQYFTGGYVCEVTDGTTGCFIYNLYSYGCVLASGEYANYITDGSGSYLELHNDGFYSNGYFSGYSLQNGDENVHLTIDTCEWRYFSYETGGSYLYSNCIPLNNIISGESGNLWYTFEKGIENLADGPYSNGYYASGNLTGLNYGLHRQAIDNLNYYFYDIDDGSVFYAGEVYSGLRIKCAVKKYIFIQDFNTFEPYSYFDLVLDGSGCIFVDNFRYIESGHLFCSVKNKNYFLDGSGYYYCTVETEKNIAKITPNINIKFDFDFATKENYFNCISATGEDLYFSFYDDDNIFYEINSTSCLNKICFKEINSGCALFLDNIKKPFIYFRNIGTGELLIKAAPDLSCCFSFKENQLNGSVNSCCLFYKLSSGEGAAISLHTSIDGSEYISKAYYPFGFFYEFKNVEQYNPLGVFPACCAINNLQEVPLYIYEDICNILSDISSDFVQCRQKIKSFCFNSIVDQYVDLVVDFNKNIFINENKISDTIQKNICINSIFGNNFYCSNININCVSIFDQNNNSCLITDFDNESYNLNITGDAQICLLYNFNFNKCKYLNYIYCHVNTSFADSSFILENTENLDIVDITSGSCGEYNFIIPQANVLNVCVLLTGQNALNKINIGNVNLECLFLPPSEEFEYCFSKDLVNSNYGFQTATSGNWVSQLDLNNQKYINCIEVITYNDGIYDGNKPYYYDFCLDFSENRISTDSITQKNINSNGEYYGYIYSSEKKYAKYCCLNFEYYPLVCIYFNDQVYEIPDINIDFVASGNCKIEVINFPVQALNSKKIKLLTNNELVEKIKCLDIYLNYFDQFCIHHTCNIGNTSCLLIPIISSGFSYPNICMDICSNFLLQNNMNFYANPFENFVNDPTYCLNAMLLLISSNINDGIAAQKIQMGEAFNCDTNYFCTGSVFCNNYFSGSITGSGYIPFYGYTYILSGSCQICINCYLPDCSIVCDCDNESITNCPVYFSGKCAYNWFYRCYNLNNQKIIWNWCCANINQQYACLYDCTCIPLDDYVTRCLLNLDSSITYVYSYQGLHEARQEKCFLPVGSNYSNYTGICTYIWELPAIYDVWNTQEECFKTFIFNIAASCGCYTGFHPVYDLSILYTGELCNSLLLDIESEYFSTVSQNTGFIIPTGDWCLFANRVYLCEYQYNDLMPYKSTGANGYNYILPINTGIYFSDLNYSGLGITENDSVFCLSGIFNNKSITRNYCGGSVCEYVNYTCCNCFSSNQHFNYNSTTVYIDSGSLLASLESKRIYIEKKYTYSGVQPLYIESNYGLNDISYPILTSSLCAFCESNNQQALSGTYYYMYDISNPLSCKIKIIAPEMTTFNCIVWQNLTGGYDSISFRNETRDLGIVKSNLAQIDLNFMSLLNNNCFYRQPCLDRTININIIGGL